MPKLTPRQIQQGELKLLNKPPRELCNAGTLRQLKSARRNLRGKTKAILVQAVFQKKSSIPPSSLSSPDALPGDVVSISETIRGSSWANAVRLWLQEDPFLELARAVTLSRSPENILGFLIVLRNCPGDPDMLPALHKACDKIVKGKRLLPYFRHNFDFTVYDPDKLCDLERKKMMRDKMQPFKMVAFDSVKDILVVMHIQKCSPFREFLGCTMDQRETAE